MPWTHAEICHIPREILMLPTDAKARKDTPIASGVVDYFPDALAAVAAVSKIGGEQHNPGKPLFWDRSKSKDEADCLMRHFLERGTLDTDGMRHSAKVAWRALALLQKEIEAAAVQPNDYVAEAVHDEPALRYCPPCDRYSDSSGWNALCEAASVPA